MGIKEAVSSNYLDDMKERFGSHPNTIFHKVFMTGTGREGSIGAEIAGVLQARGHEVVACHEDVTGYLGEQRSIINSCTALVLCHGKMHLDWFEDTPTAHLREVVNVNLWGSMNVANLFVQETMHLPVRKKIISIGSMAYKAVLNGSAAYCASKAGLAHFMKCLAWELAPKAYDVFSVHPSNTDGAPMSEDTIRGLMRYRNLSREAAEEYWSANNPRAKFLSKGEIADLCAFLLTPSAQYLSGSNLELAGGQR